MAELSTEPTATTSCCSTETKASCCEPSETDGCCSPDTPPDIRETVREKYAAAARAVAEQQSSASCCGPIALTDADETRVFGAALYDDAGHDLSLIHISEPTRRPPISY